MSPLSGPCPLPSMPFQESYFPQEPSSIPEPRHSTTAPANSSQRGQPSPPGTAPGPLSPGKPGLGETPEARAPAPRRPAPSHPTDLSPHSSSPCHPRGAPSRRPRRCHLSPSQTPAPPQNPVRGPAAPVVTPAQSLASRAGEPEAGSRPSHRGGGRPVGTGQRTGAFGSAAAATAPPVSSRVLTRRHGSSCQSAGHAPPTSLRRRGDATPSRSRDGGTCSLRPGEGGREKESKVG